MLVSTHSMEEADAIADRIAIMVHGSLKACGECMSLKSKYGLGYTLHCLRALPLDPASAPHLPHAAGCFTRTNVLWTPPIEFLGSPEYKSTNTDATEAAWLISQYLPPLRSHLTRLLAVTSSM